MTDLKKTCPVCGGSDWTELIEKSPWIIKKCTSCGLGMLDPRPTPEELTELYKAEYFEDQYDEGLAPGSDAMRRRLSQERHRYKFFWPFKKRGRVLDVGCGRGYFLLACRGQGFEVQGFDVSEDGAKYVRETLNIPVKTGQPAGAFGANEFDVITMWHALEHVEDPNEYMTLLDQWLKPDGVLVIDVPNYASTDARLKWENWEGWVLPYHLWHHTPASLEMLLQKHGYEIIRRKHYHSQVIKDRLKKIPLVGLFARAIAKLYSGTSYAVVARKKKPAA